MKKSLIIIRCIAGVACLSVPTVALAQECDRSAGTLPYCKCLYNEALERIMEKQGTSSSSMMQRLEALKKALERCIGGATSDLETEVQKI